MPVTNRREKFYNEMLGKLETAISGLEIEVINKETNPNGTFIKSYYLGDTAKRKYNFAICTQYN
jgi:hypothetical protein